MKIDFRYCAMFLALGACFSSCSDDDSDNRSFVTVTFENTGGILAGPTSYGANLYYGYEGTQYSGAEVPVTDDVKLQFGLNVSSWTGQKDFYGGGLILSNWNCRSNSVGKENTNWWYSYENQCSVYNTKSPDGANSGAGANDSNTFAIAFGYDAPESSNGAAKLTFTGKAEFPLVSIQVCNTSYAFGTMLYGNPFGNTPDKDLLEAKGWFKVQFYGYDSNGNPTNGGRPVELYLADGRTDKSFILDSWTICDLTPLGKVNSVKINFDGSDKGQYGINTPTYVALDDLVIETTPETRQ